MSNGRYRDRFCKTVGFFLPIEVLSFPGPQQQGTGGSLGVVFVASRTRPPAIEMMHSAFLHFGHIGGPRIVGRCNMQ
jgi:hypothetical protein